MPPNTVKVARPSKWGNPYRIGDGQDALDCVEQFRLMVARKDDAALRMLLEPLRGKNLACWCPLDAPCHADVLLVMANVK